MKPEVISHLRNLLVIQVLLLFGNGLVEVQAAKLVAVGVLDRDYLVVHFSDGEVVHEDEVNKVETVIRHSPELDTSAAEQPANWIVTSQYDANYDDSGAIPLSCSRKTKLSGHGEMEWAGDDFHYEYTYDHWLYLRLPSPLLQGGSYQLTINPAVNSDQLTAAFTFNEFNSISEAIHVNLVGYNPDAPHKAADLYHWMGSDGGRDYSAFAGNAVYLYNVDSQVATQVGNVAFGKASGIDVHGVNLTGSDVWNIDFVTIPIPGTYRLVVEDVGCSQDFEITRTVYHDPFATLVRGYFYMRVGDSNPNFVWPPPRTPLYIPGESPAGTTVYLTSMHPYHADWSSFSSGDPWDKPDDWSAYKKSSAPFTSNNGWGGHADAADWDRHLSHIINIYDLLLPYIMSKGTIADDNLGISESGNGIPDIIDEARYEVDFWLRLRDGEGYSYGLTNPNSSNELYQAGTTGLAAWANAANAAMLADALRIAGQSSLSQTYRDAAIAAYNYAQSLTLADQMLDDFIYFDEGLMHGRDLKMMAAAYLYNVTGDTAYEDVVYTESVCAASQSRIQYFNTSTDGINQLYGTAAYLITPQTVHYPVMYANMKNQLIAEAKSEEANLMNTRPSRRTTYNPPSYWRTAHFVDRTIVAHAIADNQDDKDYFHKALALEADWGLGRNPLNIIEMTTATTPLAAKRSILEAATSGRDDGVEGVHPGHTPYLNLEDWWPLTMGKPSRLYANSFPADVLGSWPRGETYFPSRWVYAHTEYTPRQTMKGKAALYGYLYSLAGTTTAESPALTVMINAGDGSSGTVSSVPAGIICGSDCTETYDFNTPLTLTATAGPGSAFIGWRGNCVGSESTCNVTMNFNRTVIASFRSSQLSESFIYDDSLASGWESWSWGATINLAGTSPLHAGTYSIDLTSVAGWSGFSAANVSASLATTGYDNLAFWVHGGMGTDKQLSVSLEEELGTIIGSKVITAIAGSWTEQVISLGELGNPAKIKRITFQNNSGSQIDGFALDEIRLVPQQVPTVAGDVDGNGVVELADVVRALQLLTDATVSARVGADVNGDGRIGLEEAIYDLHLLMEAE